MRDIKTLIEMLEDLKTKLKKYKEDDSGTYSFYEDLQYHLNSIPIEPPVMQKIAEGWISVDDKLPKGDLISEWVLVCYEPMGCGELIRNLGWYDGKWWLDSKTLLEEWEIKYWMPLPELPIDDSNFSA